MRMLADARRRGLQLAITGAVVAAGVSMPTTAHAAPAGIDRVGYECQATNPVVNATLEGNYQFYVTARTDLPERVEAGQTVPATDTTLTLTLSEPLVTHLYNKMSVRRVKGSSRSDVTLQAVFPGGEVENLSEPVNGLVVPDWVEISPGSEVDIAANGTVDAVAVPDNAPNGLIYVQMPKVFFLDSHMDPPVLGSVAETELRCERQSDAADARVIGTIAIGDGCPESDCPLADEDPGQPGGGGGGGGGEAGTEPDVIDPTVPDPETAISDSDYGWDDGESGGAVSARTTELPATGSGLGAGLGALFAALVAVRVALAVRTRRGARS